MKVLQHDIVTGVMPKLRNEAKRIVLAALRLCLFQGTKPRAIIPVLVSFDATAYIVWQGLQKHGNVEDCTYE